MRGLSCLTEERVKDLIGRMQIDLYYEGYSENPELVKNLSSMYIKQLQSYGIAATAKHFIADGATIWGTGDSGYKIDQGYAIIEEGKLLKGNQTQPSGVNILEGFEKIAKENGGTIITDIKKAEDADVTVVVIGEESYAEEKAMMKLLD